MLCSNNFLLSGGALVYCNTSSQKDFTTAAHPPATRILLLKNKTMGQSNRFELSLVGKKCHIRADCCANGAEARGDTPTSDSNGNYRGTRAGATTDTDNTSCRTTPQCGVQVFDYRSVEILSSVDSTFVPRCKTFKAYFSQIAKVWRSTLIDRGTPRRAPHCSSWLQNCDSARSCSETAALKCTALYCTVRLCRLHS